MHTKFTTDIELKIVLNVDHGGFGISDLAWKKMVEYGYEGSRYDIEKERHNPILIRVVEELGEFANDESSKLDIHTFKIGYSIKNHDGYESNLKLDMD